MGASSFISGKLSIKGAAAVISLAVSFLVMILAISISNGFGSEIRKALATMMGDISISPVGQEAKSFKADKDMIREIMEVEGVNYVRPAIFATGIVQNEGHIHGVVFKGVPSEDSGTLRVCIPSRLASKLYLKPGDRLQTYFIGAGVVPRNFVVDETYDAIDAGDDRIVVICDINTLRRVNRWEDGMVSTLEVVLEDRYRNDDMSFLINSRISHILYNHSDQITLISTRSRMAYRQIFDWLNLINFNVMFILMLMIVVAGLNMTSGLLILLFENISTIGLLKSLGMRKIEIADTFLKSSSRLVLLGMAIGNGAATGLCLLQDKTHLLRLNPESYFINFVPMKMDWTLIAICDVSAFLAIMLILTVPCAFISKVDPAVSMREK